MICKNCGFHNEKGDEFCGSCGQFLEWTGVVAEEPAPEMPAAGATGEPTTVAGGQPPTTQPPTGRPTGKPIELPASGGGPMSAGAGAATGAGAPASADTGVVTTTPVRPAKQPDVICWNCKTRNKAGRTFCLKCGERLTTAGGGGRGRLLAVLIGIVALVLLAAGAAVFFLGGAPAPSPTPTASPSPRPVSPSPSATARPTASPSPSPVASECATAAEPVRTVELNRQTSERRSGQATAWCIRDVTFVARRGSGVLRLQLTNPTAFPDAPGGTIDWLTARMPEDFYDSDEYHPPITFPTSLQLVPAGTTITLLIECSSDACNGRAHIAYDRIAAP